ncbi:hypothetical protein MTR_4g125320 [Medicago truncatula]|uniref:Uncharacterized protein n=1 Tax=Medicago truncatula TaxID=3880 RepID=A0A072URL9_MEDTR|nr:hypothetical protein MTR_4g125320 [Medicago truncatula]
MSSNKQRRCKNGKIDGGGGRQLRQRDEEGGDDGEGKRTVVKRVAAEGKMAVEDMYISKTILEMEEVFLISMAVGGPINLDPRQSFLDSISTQTHLDTFDLRFRCIKIVR